MGRGVKPRDSLWAPRGKQQGDQRPREAGPGARGGRAAAPPGVRLELAATSAARRFAWKPPARADGGGVGRRRASVAARDQCAASAAGPASPARSSPAARWLGSELPS